MDLNKYILNEEYFHIGNKTTVCLLTLQNGFEIVGTSACSGGVEYNKEVGEGIARELAIQKLYEYLTIKSALDYKKGGKDD